MARELNSAPDYAPINPGELAMYELPQHEGEMTTLLSIEGVNVGCPFREHDDVREYEVEVEFRHDERSIEAESFAEYLRSYEDAHISQEMMARFIRTDILRVLDIEEAFVEVRCTDSAIKKARIGKL